MAAVAVLPEVCPLARNESRPNAALLGITTLAPVIAPAEVVVAVVRVEPPRLIATFSDAPNPAPVTRTAEPGAANFDATARLAPVFVASTENRVWPPVMSDCPEVEAVLAVTV